MDVTSPKILAALAAVLASGVFGAGCGSGKREPSQAGTTSTTSVHVSPTPVQRPIAPRGYRVPRGALRISSSAELAAALDDHRRETIVLARGVYDNPRPFSDREGDRIYASRLGRAVFRTGIVLGSNSGPPGALIRGLTFSVADPAKTLDGAIVHVWGSAAFASVLDTRIDGHGAVGAGVTVRQPNGFVGKRIVATHFQSYGVVVDPNDTGYRAKTPFSLRDLTISRVSRSVPGSSGGRAEACLWLGSPGSVHRVSVSRCAITGVWTGTATHGSRIEDVTVQRSRVGIYIEHFTTGTTFEFLRVGPGVSRGINAEWANYALGGKPASVNNVIQDAWFRTDHVGIYLDQGTTRTLIRYCKFVGQHWAAIGDYRGVGNEYYHNDFEDIAPGAVTVSSEHDPGGGNH